MTTIECAATLYARDPKRSYCVAKDAWAYECGDKTATYRVSALPGPKGEKCASWSADTLEAAMAQAEAALFPQTEDTNNE